MNNSRKCKYGKYVRYSNQDVIVCNINSDSVCCFQYPCKQCSGYVMTEGYENKCKKYIEEENKIIK